MYSDTIQHDTIQHNIIMSLVFVYYCYNLKQCMCIVLMYPDTI